MGLVNTPVETLALALASDHASVAMSSAQNVTVHVRISAAAMPPSDTSRPPLRLATVLDRSGSMGGNKIQLLKTTMRVLIGQLTAADSLAIVIYDTEIETILPLTPMTADAKRRALDAVGRIQPRGSTNLCDGLLAGLDILAAADTAAAAAADAMVDAATPTGAAASVSSVLLLTDGQANASFKTAGEISHLMRVRRDARAAQVAAMERDASHTAKITAELENLYVAVPTVHTFGFGNDADVTLLKAISSVGSNGSYYYIESEPNIGAAFGDCLGGLLTTVAKDVSLRVTSSTPSATIAAVHTSFPYTLDSDKRAATIRFPDVQAEETRDTLITLALAAVDAPGDCAIGAHVTFADMLAAAAAAGGGASATLSRQLVVRRDEATVTLANIEIETQKNRIAAAAALEAAARAGDYAEGKRLLQRARDEMLTSPAASDATTAVFLSEISEAESRMVDQRTYHESAIAYCTNASNQHQNQRSASSSVSASSPYKSSSKAKAQSMFMSYM